MPTLEDKVKLRTVPLSGTGTVAKPPIPAPPSTAISKTKFKGSKPFVKVILVILIFALMLLIYQFSQLQKSTDSQTTPTSERTEDTFEIITADGALVPNFPEFPQYPGATLISSYAKNEDVIDYKQGFEATWHIESPIPPVAQWYTQKLAEENWDIVFPSEDPQNTGEQFIIAEKGDLSVYLTIENETNSEISEIHAEFPVVE